MGNVIITGVTGQDGSHMVDYLLANTDHKIFGAIRRLSVQNHSNIEHLEGNPRFSLIELDVTDSESIENAIREIQPSFFLNFAANSFVGTSWKMPVNHFKTNAMGVLHQLEAIRKHCPKCRYYNAGSSEEFGDVVFCPQDETHPLRPRSPYGASKAAARHMVKVWRDSYALYAIQGVLYNHESPGRRGKEFISRKITLKVAEIREAFRIGGPFIPLEVGNINAKRDWSDARDFVRGVWMMMNQEGEPQEYVLSSNETHTVREFIEKAFLAAGIAGVWSGEGLDEKFCLDDGTVIVRINSEFYRPAEVHLLHGNSNRARNELGWKPEYSFDDLVTAMVKHDIKLAKESCQKNSKN